ncbi:MAG: hypothetical protein J5738_08880 [Lachnospiraceae bacterium]|nr:hypothetical protein [Lachnospiraceae bacterium]MBR5761165.1 hypothetical protein [Lachnospiraceae bacterium]
MRKKNKLMVVGVILVAILSGCGGVSESDYKKMEERVKELEQKLEDQENSGNNTSTVGVTSQPGNTPTTEVSQKGVYDLSDRSPQQIIYEIEDLMALRAEGKVVNEAIEAMRLRYEPKRTTGDRNNGTLRMDFESSDKDHILSIDYTFQLKDAEKWLIDKALSVRIRINIVDFERAEIVYSELVRAHYASAVNPQKTDTEWNAHVPGGGFIRLSIDPSGCQIYLEKRL